MTLKITPDLIRAGYELLSETEPFNRWNLPPSDDIKFISHRSRDYGAFQTIGPDMIMYVSSSLVGHLSTLLVTIAHEMIHLHQHRTGLEIDHGPAFKKWAATVCRHHRDFDPLNF